MAKQIPLTKGKFATVDDSDYNFLNQWKWYCDACGYAVRTVLVDGKKGRVWMHRIVAGTPKNMLTDHINMDRLDNTKKNLRIVTKSQNGMNRGVPSNSTTGYKGVVFRNDTKKYRAYISLKNKRAWIGQFNTALEAAVAYNKKAFEMFGEFAKLNIINE